MRVALAAPPEVIERKQSVFMGEQDALLAAVGAAAADLAVETPKRRDSVKKERRKRRDSEEGGTPKRRDSSANKDRASKYEALEPEPLNLIRTALIPVVMAVASFGDAAGYRTIRMLAVGLLHKLCASSEDVLKVVSGYALQSDFVKRVLDAARGAQSTGEAIEEEEEAIDDRSTARATKRLQILAVELTFRLTECEDGAKTVKAAGGPRALEELCAELLKHPRHYALRTTGAFRAAKLATTAGGRARRRL